jgi:adenine-specific DNA-methyltransferase
MSQTTDNTKPETVADLMPQTPDLRGERLAALRKLFPDLFDGEGRLQEKELRSLADPSYYPAAERYEFPWTGKARSKREAFTPSRAALVYDKSRSFHPDMAGGNVIIEGENLEVLKLLTSAYRERVKLIYIDPPYNTGKDFIYSDDYTEGRKPYWEESGVTDRGVKVDTNSDSEGRFHSSWLSMMHARLLVARYLLQPDGVLFVSIDENELHNLRRLANEVFGEENYVGTISWRNVTDNNPTRLTKDNEFVLIFARDVEKQPEEWKSAFSDAKDLLEAEFQRLKLLGFESAKIEEEIRKFISGNAEVLGNLTRYKWADDNDLYTGSESVHNPRPGGYDFEVIHPDTKKPMRKPATGYRFPEATFRELQAQDVILYGDNEDQIVKIKKYLRDFRESLRSVITLDGRLGSYDMKRLFDGDAIFTNPKPVDLLKQFLGFTSYKNSIVLDFFGGSGTTAQAVMDLNAADGGSRRFILMQLPEFTKEDSAAYKAGYKKISSITIERSKRVIERYRKEVDGMLPTDPKRQYAESLGFKVFTLEKSNFPRVDFAPDPAKTEAENVELLKAYIREKEDTFARTWDRDRILDEVLLKNGFMLDYSLSPAAEFSKNRVDIIKDAHRTALLCLDESIAPETVDAFRNDKESTFICLEAALDTTKKWNLKHHLGDRLRAV